MSPESRENYQQLYGSLWQEWQANVRRARPQANIRRVTGDIPAWLEASGGDLAKAALEAGLADKIGTRVEWGERVAAIAGEDDWDETPGAFAHTELDPWLAETEPDEPGGKIGVITIAGEISDGRPAPARRARSGSASCSTTRSTTTSRRSSCGSICRAARSPAPKRSAARSCATRPRSIPIVVSMGNVAASGGYWVATPAERIFAEPETITGSIGIFGVIPTFEDALAEWGVTTDGVRTTPLSGQPDLLAGFTPETEAILQATVESGYERFLTLVAQLAQDQPRARRRARPGPRLGRRRGAPARPGRPVRRARRRRSPMPPSAPGSRKASGTPNTSAPTRTAMRRCCAGSCATTTAKPPAATCSRCSRGARAT